MASMQLLQVQKAVALTSTPDGLLITAVQTGSIQNASDEFIELTNTANRAIALADYVVQYFPATAKDFTKPSRIMALQGEVAPSSAYVIATSQTLIPNVNQTFNSTLAAGGGHLRLTYQGQEVDRLGWGTAGLPMVSAAVAPGAGQVLRRNVDSNHMLMQTGNNKQDFAVSSEPLVARADGSSVDTSMLRITEVLPDPASPVTDAEGEFIELHNSSAQTIDLSAYKIVVGSQLSKKYILSGHVIGPGEYKAFYSDQTKLTLSNSTSRVVLSTVNDNTIDQLSYALAKVGQSYAWSGEQWYWTSSPTPNQANQFAADQNSNTSKPATGSTKKVAGKGTAPKTSKKATSNTASTKTKSKNARANTMQVKPPVHTGVVAGVGGAAVLYGAYEYRQDAANFFRQLRRHRKNR